MPKGSSYAPIGVIIREFQDVDTSDARARGRNSRPTIRLSNKDFKARSSTMGLATSAELDVPLRRTGIPLIGDVPWGAHFCQFYEDSQDLIG